MLALSSFVLLAPAASACGGDPLVVQADDGDSVEVWVDGGNTAEPATGEDFTCGGVSAANSSQHAGPWGCKRTADLVYPYACYGKFFYQGQVCDVRWKDMAVDGNPFEFNDQIESIHCA